MTDIVIIYSSFAGKTRKISEYLAKKLDADVFDLKKQSNIDLTAYSKVIFGTGVHAGKPYGRVSDFIENNRSVLNDKDLHLFISCMYKGDRAERQLSDIVKDYGFHNGVYFSTRSEKNAEGLSVDVDAYAERMKN